MKLLLVLVYAIAVFTVDGRDFSRESEIHDTANEDQLFPEELENQGESQYFLDGTDGNNLEDIYNPTEKTQLLMEKSLLVADGHDESDSAYDAYQMKDGNLYLEETKEHPNGKLRRSRCKARNACVVMGGFCVTNATLCSGRLVPEGCKGINCQCCVPGTIEAKFDNLEEELQSLKENMNSELQSLKIYMNNSNTNVNSKLQSLKVDADNMNSKLDLIAKNQECPGGLFHLASKEPKQCFKFFTSSKISWTAAKSKCQSEGLVLARPNYPVELRRLMVESYGDKRSWIGARGTGSAIKWDNGTTLSTSSSVWYPGWPGSRTSSSDCVVYATDTSNMNRQPNHPYYINYCTTSNYLLCEMLVG